MTYTIIKFFIFFAKTLDSLAKIVMLIPMSNTEKYESFASQVNFASEEEIDRANYEADMAAQPPVFIMGDEELEVLWQQEQEYREAMGLA